MLTVIGFFATTLEASNTLKKTSFLLETEVEEVFEEKIDELYLIAQDSVSQKSNSGGNAIISVEKSYFNPLYFGYTIPSFCNKKPPTKKIAYFILYCCLKINC